MKKLNRRDFNALTAAAMGGLVAGGIVGCGGDAPAPTADNSGDPSQEMHLCRGLNSCKGNGAKGENACRGQGACATIAAHECGPHNACKGQGGCGPDVGKNKCKTHGGCSVPLMDSAWETMRERMETEWKEKNLEFGEAPPKVEA